MIVNLDEIADVLIMIQDSKDETDMEIHMRIDKHFLQHLIGFITYIDKLKEDGRIPSDVDFLY